MSDRSLQPEPCAAHGGTGGDGGGDCACVEYVTVKMLLPRSQCSAVCAKPWSVSADGAEDNAHMEQDKCGKANPHNTERLCEIGRGEGRDTHTHTE
jgi:hypothetical protein